MLVEETKLMEFCEERGFDATINWRERPVSLHLLAEAEPSLFGPGENEQPVKGEAMLALWDGKITCSFLGFEIGMTDLAKIAKLFGAAYMRHLEDYYMEHSR